MLELEHVKPVAQRSAIRKADAVLPAFARAGQRSVTTHSSASRSEAGVVSLLFLFGVKHVTGVSKRSLGRVSRCGGCDVGFCVVGGGKNLDKIFDQ